MRVDIFQKFGRVAAGKIIVRADNHSAVMRDTFNLRKIAVNFGMNVVKRII